MLLPVWVLHATYDGRSYTFMMNGQTGKLVGELPISRGRSWAWFGAVCGGVTAAATLAGSPVPAFVRRRWNETMDSFFLLRSF